MAYPESFIIIRVVDGTKVMTNQQYYFFACN